MISDMIIKITLLSICACIITLLLRQYQASYVVLINIAFTVIVLLLVINSYSDSFKAMKDLFAINSATKKMFMSLFKAASVCVLSKIASDICKESKNNTVADIIEFSGRIMLLGMALPYIESVIKTATSFIK